MARNCCNDDENEPTYGILHHSEGVDLIPANMSEKAFAYKMKLEVSEMTCWVYEHKVEMEWTVDQMVRAFPEGEKFIRIIDVCIDSYDN